VRPAGEAPAAQADGFDDQGDDEGDEGDDDLKP
jgi:hypothetical protein